MSTNNIRGAVWNASRVPMMQTVDIYGICKYTIGSNVISLGDNDIYSLEQLAKDFGQSRTDGAIGDIKFKCGRSYVDPFDLGLLFSCFVAMTAAYASSGTSIYACEGSVGVNYADVRAVWFGNNLLIYSRRSNIIVSADSSNVFEICTRKDVELRNFASVDNYVLSRNGYNITISDNKKNFLCNVEIPMSVQRTYPNLFDGDESNDEIVDCPSTPWDERSALGRLIASSVSRTGIEATVNKYIVSNTSSRDDIICKPKTKFDNASEIIGSLCYTDKGEIVMGVNFRNGLFIYKPWYTGDSGNSLKLDSNPNLGDFYNVSEECRKISLYANSVVVRPLTPAKFTSEVFEDIKDSFNEVKLTRRNFAGSLGRIVIPEPVLVSSLTEASSDALYCIVPVGAIGDSVIVKDADGNISCMPLSVSETNKKSWDLDSFFYDITEVISDAIF